MPKYRIVRMKQHPQFTIEVQRADGEFEGLCHGTSEEIDEWLAVMRKQDGEIVSDVRAIAASA